MAHGIRCCQGGDQLAGAQAHLCRRRRGVGELVPIQPRGTYCGGGPVGRPLHLGPGLLWTLRPWCGHRSPQPSAGGELVGPIYGAGVVQIPLRSGRQWSNRWLSASCTP